MRQRILNILLFVLWILTPMAATSSQLLPKELTTRLQTISSDFVIVQIWNPFCEPCGKEVQELNHLLKKEDKKISVLGIPVQSRRSEIKAFVDHYQPHYEQWIPDRDFTDSLLHERKIPSTILFGKNRLLLKEWIGWVSSQEILNEINRLNKERKNKI